MKTKTLVLIGVLIIALAAMAMPVMADDTADISLTGNPTATVTVDTSGTLDAWELTPHATNPSTSGAVSLTISSNCPFTIKVYDALTDDKPAATVGYMSEVTIATGDYVTESQKTLTNKLAIYTDNTNGITGSDVTSIPVAGSAATLWAYSGTGGFASQSLPMTFSQLVPFTDARLDGTTKTYRIPLVFSMAIVA